ncbi:ATPase [Endozoicomonas sp. (ex Bugula neritina AB1)]|nr:ATPase [Endozoicomonas sp. (ex Bugula neritina AB1)]
MSFDLEPLIFVSVAYLLLLFSVAWITDKGWIPQNIVRHPITYVLSLGVYASSWAYYGGLGIAKEGGYLFLTLYFGISGAFLLAPILLAPILKITRAYQLSSLADLFAFRFRSSAAGMLATLLMLASIMPLLALQIQAVSDSIHLINQDISRGRLAFLFCVLVTLFAILFGTKHISSHEHHQGLVMAMAAESLLKLAVMITLGVVALTEVFGGFDGLQIWLNNNDLTPSLHQPVEDGPWRGLLLLFFASVIVMPHMFHMTFTENRDGRSLNIASWGLPLFLLMLSFSVPILTWAGIKLNLQISPEYYALGLGQALNMPWLTIVSFMGSLTAASGLIIVTTLALSSMILNHLVMPYWRPNANLEVDIYRALVWLKRVLISALIITSYGFYLLFDTQHSLYNLGIVAFVGVLQLLPGTLCTLYWPKANHYGIIAGLFAGGFVWLITMLIPLMVDISRYDENYTIFQNILFDQWHQLIFLTLAVNSGLVILVSLITKMSPAEANAAAACQVENPTRNARKTPKAASTYEFHEMLSSPLGSVIARKEVQKAMTDLNMREDENRPHALRRLRERLEKNLSGLLGPTVAHNIVETSLPWDQQRDYVAQDIHFMESRLESYHSRLSGLAAELDSLRRYHRDTLDKLPLALFSVDANSEIMLWNQAMARMTGIDTGKVLGLNIRHLAPPWNELLSQLSSLDNTRLNKHSIEVDGLQRYFSIHKATIEAPASGTSGNQVMLLEDRTENQALENQLFHSERLASIGQLAAGVAHEIGNPITAIDCLAQELKAFSDEPDTQEVAGQVLDQTQRVTRIVQMLVSYAHNGQTRHEDSKLSPVSLTHCVEEAVSLLKLSHKSDNVKFLNRCKPDHKVIGDQQKLQQVLINLLSNAVDASAEGGQITLSTEATPQTVTLFVEDQGHGIPANIQDRLFEPFFTTKEAGKGTGLGLALTWNIIEEHFGTIRIDSPVNKILKTGTRFIISLPRSEVSESKLHDTNKYDGKSMIFPTVAPIKEEAL